MQRYSDFGEAPGRTTICPTTQRRSPCSWIRSASRRCGPPPDRSHCTCSLLEVHRLRTRTRTVRRTSGFGFPYPSDEEYFLLHIRSRTSLPQPHLLANPLSEIESPRQMRCLPSRSLTVSPTDTIAGPASLPASILNLRPRIECAHWIISRQSDAPSCCRQRGR